MEPFVIPLIIVGVVVVLFLVLWISAWNKLIQLSGQVNQTIGQLSAQYQQRFDLIPDVLRAAKAAVKAQREYLDKMLEIRKGMRPGLKPSDLGNMPPDFMPMALAAGAPGVTVENNPQLSVAAYEELQRIMQNTEKDVAAARRFYWAAVTEYNVAVRSFPGRCVASVHGFDTLPDAIITPEQEKKPDYDIDTR